jgi:hypothetical protein
MISHLVAGTKRVLKLHHPGRSLLVLSDDVFLVSFPKSGNTWARFLLANLLYPNSNPNFSNIHDLMPDPEVTTKRRFDSMPRPRIIKSHGCFDPRYKRVIYIVRDPRDVAVSQFHYLRKRKVIDDTYTLEKFIPHFLAGDLTKNGSWGHNVITWLTTRRCDRDFLQLRYEDMMADANRELTRVANFLGMPSDPQRVAQAVERSSADRMRKMEQAQSDNCSLTKNTRQDIAFVRSAKSGGWRSSLPENLVADIEEAWGPLMSYLGYELLTQSASIHANNVPAFGVQLQARAQAVGF